MLVAVDFDGTIAALVDDPVQARMLPAARSALERLVAADGVSVALLSGRRLKELRFVAAPPAGVLAIGSHGAEGIDGKVDLTEEQEGLLARLVEAVDDIVLEFSGTRTEVKPTGVVLHTRTAEPKIAEPATRAAVEGPGSWSGVRTLVGSGVVELAVVDLDKGTALHRLTDRLGTTATFFAGDDSTDEFAFRALRPGRDVTVKVGTTATAADYRVPRPTDLAAVLEQLADLATGPGRLPSEGG